MTFIQKNNTVNVKAELHQNSHTHSLLRSYCLACVRQRQAAIATTLVHLTNITDQQQLGAGRGDAESSGATLKASFKNRTKRKCHRR